MSIMYMFIHHEGSTVYMQCKTDRKIRIQTDKTHTHKKHNSPTISTDQILQIQLHINVSIQGGPKK